VTGLLIGFLSAGLVLGGRSQGWLQPAELWAYDQFIKLQTHDAPDPNLLIVAVNEEDIRTFGHFGQPLPDLTVHQLLTKLEKYQPKVIGLDIFRDAPQPPNQRQVGGGWQELTQFLRTRNRVITTCTRTSDGGIPIAPPPGVPNGQIGYATTLMTGDPGAIVRRYLIAQEVEDQSSCSTTYSFALQVIRHALPEKYQFHPGTGVSVGTRHLLETLKSDSGGYQLPSQEPLGYQLLIDYRPDRIARMASLTDIFNARDSDLQMWIKDHIVLIGYARGTPSDQHLTPRGIEAGVVLHAYIVSQLLQSISGQKPLFSFWSKPVEMIWILGWSAIAGLIVWQAPKRMVLILLGMAGVLLFSSSFGLFFKSIWVPLIPASLALLLTGSVGIVLKTSFPNIRT
jgi:CHASE2 domain-containing sensor protein